MRGGVCSWQFVQLACQAGCCSAVHDSYLCCFTGMRYNGLLVVVWRFPLQFAPLDHHGMPIGEPPALIPASPVKGKRSRSHHHHHHRPHHQQQHAHHHLAAEGAVFHPPLEATSSLDVPASDHHRHHHKKKTKKRKHVEDIAGGREQGDLGQPASKRVKAVQ